MHKIKRKIDEKTKNLYSVTLVAWRRGKIAYITRNFTDENSS